MARPVRNSDSAARTLIIGDVHGCAVELERLVDAVQPTQVVLVGDLFTKGPDPGGVWRQIRNNGWLAVLGNQDERLLNAIDAKGTPKRKVAMCIAALNREDSSWLAWLRERPLFLEVAGVTVVHAGLHPRGRIEDTTRDMALNMRWFPMSDPDAPRWHEQYTGDRRVVFGHDARRGLVRHRRGLQTWLVGLDSGCVYGKQLSGYIVEEDRIEQVKAAATYQSV